MSDSDAYSKMPSGEARAADATEAKGERHERNRLITSRSEIESAMDGLLASATSLIRVFDRRIGSRFDAPKRIAVLRHLLLANRSNRIRIALHDVSNLVRDCPRLLALQRQFSHALAIHQTEPYLHAIADSIALADQHHCLHRFHQEHARASLIADDAEAVQPLSMRFEEIWQASHHAVGPSTLGL
ncbi:MAG TPA: hypothetical protein VFB54_01310 [Burkholderiales bacterium]|nr:hypothetical protein [Burkholderiales bacterium]